MTRQEMIDVIDGAALTLEAVGCRAHASELRRLRAMLPIACETCDVHLGAVPCVNARAEHGTRCVQCCDCKPARATTPRF